MRHRLIAIALLASGAGPAAAGPLTIVVSGAQSDQGTIDCALFSGPEGFPMEGERARRTSVPVSGGGATCRFEDAEPGAYAVSVSHDENGNGMTDTNFFGIPPEAWGVSGGARPSLRAPRFEEARFEIGAEGATVRVEIAE